MLDDDENQIPNVPVDLAHVQTDDLLEELLNRYDHASFTGFKVMTVNSSEHKMRWCGNQHLVVGLLQDLSIAVLDSLHDGRIQGTLEDQEDIGDEP